jgi:AcrR family transcriptional regulator
VLAQALDEQPVGEVVDGEGHLEAVLADVLGVGELDACRGDDDPDAVALEQLVRRAGDRAERREVTSDDGRARAARVELCRDAGTACGVAAEQHDALDVVAVEQGAQRLAAEPAGGTGQGDGGHVAHRATWHVMPQGTACHAWRRAMPERDLQPTTTLRERKKLETREALVAAGLGLFARQGYAATSVEAIADAAGVSRRTFFRYFADKDELVFADDAEHVAAVLAAVDAQPDDVAPLDVVRAAGHAVAARLAERRDVAAIYQQLVASVPALQERSLAKQRRWEALIAERLAARPGLDAAEASLVARVGVACVQSALEPWLLAPRGDLAADVDAAFDALGRLVASR